MVHMKYLQWMMILLYVLGLQNCRRLLCSSLCPIVHAVSLTRLIATKELNSDILLISGFALVSSNNRGQCQGAHCPNKPASLRHASALEHATA